MTDTKKNYDMYSVNPQNMRKIEQTERELEELIAAERAQRMSGNREEDNEHVEEDVPEASKEPEKKAEVEKTEAKEEPTGWEKRYKDSQRYITQLNKRLKELEAKAETVEPASLNSQKDVEDWMSKNPRIASIVQKIADERAKKLFETAEDKFSAIEEMKLEATIAKTEATIMRVHPDYLEIKESDEFHKWAEDLPTAMQEALYDKVDDPKTVIRVLDFYKKETQKPVEQEDDDYSDAASSVRSRSQKSTPIEKKQKFEFTESQIGAMTQKEFEKNMDAIDKARREGRILYDLSKKS